MGKKKVRKLILARFVLLQEWAVILLSHSLYLGVGEYGIRRVGVRE